MPIADNIAAKLLAMSAALERSSLDRPVRPFKDFSHAENQKQELKTKKKRRQKVKDSRRRNR